METTATVLKHIIIYFLLILTKISLVQWVKLIEYLLMFSTSTSFFREGFAIGKENALQSGKNKKNAPKPFICLMLIHKYSIKCIVKMYSVQCTSFLELAFPSVFGE